MKLLSCILGILLPISVLSGPTVQLKSISSTESFIQNCGQWPDSILFQAKVQGTSVWFAKCGLYYQFFRKTEDSIRLPGQQLTRLVHEEFVGGNCDAEVVGEGQSSYYCNYFLGNDSSKWVRHAPTFESIRYKSIYAGVDLRYYFRNGHLEYDFVIAPDADPLAIRIRYDGIDSLFIGQDGELVAATDWGRITQKAASVFTIPSNRQLECSYVVEGKSFGFALPEVSTELAIVIDPFLTFSSYWGGSADDWGCGIAIDSFGNVFATGKTSSADFPTRLAIDETRDVDWDGYLTKFSPYCREYLYSTYYGGSGMDASTDIVVDASGKPIIGGGTQSYDLPSISAAQRVKGTETDGFVMKLNELGDEIEFATFLGNSERDTVTDLAVGPNGHIFVAGFSGSDNFITTKNAFLRHPGWDAYGIIVELPATGDSLIYSSFFALGCDQTKVAVDNEGNVILTGRTASQRFSPPFPLKNAFDTTEGESWAGFVSKFSPGFDSLVFSTYITGDVGSYFNSVAIDPSGRIHVVGGAIVEGGYWLLNALEGRYEGSYEGAASIVSPTGELLFSTLWGNREYMRDQLKDIALDAAGNIYILGHFDGTTYRLTNAFDSVNGFWEGAPSLEVTITKWSPLGRSVEYCSFLGGLGIDSAGSLAVSPNGTAYIIGTNEDGQLPLVNSLDSTFQGALDYNTDAFVAIVGDQLTDVDEDVDPALPISFYVHQNYPNPFNGETTIRFDLPRAADVSIVVYNILGEEVRTLDKRTYSAGTHTVAWDGKGNDGGDVASGVYFYSLTTPTSTITRKMLFLK